MSLDFVCPPPTEISACREWGLFEGAGGGEGGDTVEFLCEGTCHAVVMWLDWHLDRSPPPHPPPLLLSTPLPLLLPLPLSPSGCLVISISGACSTSKKEGNCVVVCCSVLYCVAECNIRDAMCFGVTQCACVPFLFCPFRLLTPACVSGMHLIYSISPSSVC